MKLERLGRVIVGLVLVCCISAGAQDKGNWRAASTTAKATTGDVALFDEKLAINFSTFTVAPIRSLDQGEVSAVFDVDSSAGGSGSLYRLNIPAAKKFLHKNSLCGSEDTEWMVTYVSGRSLQVAFFRGRNSRSLRWKRSRIQRICVARFLMCGRSSYKGEEGTERLFDRVEDLFGNHPDRPHPRLH